MWIVLLDYHFYLLGTELRTVKGTITLIECWKLRVGASYDLSRWKGLNDFAILIQRN